MSTISDIKERIDIVALLSEYVQLSKAGKNFKGLCPFHTEKHASFFVFPDRQTWRCFGSCGEGGDIFSFIMKKENLEFKEALDLLAARAGVQVEKATPADAPHDEARDRMLAAVDIAAEYFRSLLLDSDAAKKARDYFAARHIDIHGETAASFRLGYSPAGWSELRDMLCAKGHSEKELVEAGLLIERDSGGTYDRFRDRLMFPISDSAGRVIGFGARAIGDMQPKYINSPQSRIFDKGNVLYGIHRARTAARRADRIILVEGYTDVLQAHQHGWENVVAPMGTSLTEGQASGLSRITRNIYLALDADEAGQNAAMKTIRETTGRFRAAFGQKHIPEMGPKGKASFRAVLDADIRVIVMPAGKDPDETIVADPESWARLVEQAIPYVDYYVDTLVHSADTTSARGKRELISQCEPIIAELEDAMERSRFYSQLSRALQIPEREMMAELSRTQPRSNTVNTRQALREERTARRTRGDAKEEYCLSLLLTNPRLRPFAEGLSAEHFEATENRHIYDTWLSATDDSDIRSQLDASLAEHLDYLLSEPFPPGIPKDEETQRLALDDCILRLQERLSKRLQFTMETTLNRHRKDEGVEAELATLDQAGSGSAERLQEIFVQQ
ncbi:MAG: DNA primase, partial [Dehalococcoidia bacterium]|nr:DNA primase [Dehalococcoidia bacterium]